MRRPSVSGRHQRTESQPAESQRTKSQRTESQPAAVWPAMVLMGALLLGGCAGPDNDPEETASAPSTAPAGTAGGQSGSSSAPSGEAAPDSASAGQSPGPAGPVNYVALGDSYASGYGGGQVLDACGRTAQGYPALLDALDGVELDADVTCAGATALATDPAAPEGPRDLPGQIAEAEARGVLNSGTEVVTVTIGGNDVQFGSIVAACAGPQLPDTCAPAVQQAQSYAAGVLAPALAARFGQITSLAPQATLVVTGYPHLFEPGVSGPLSAAAVDLFNAGTDALNTVIASQLPDGAVFVDVVDEFSGHGAGAADSWIIFDGGPFTLHPTETGYREGYLAAIREDAGSDF